MAGDIFKFVDSIAASPTVRLDMNDGATWVLEGPSVDFPPPPLRRALAGTLLTDGMVQPSSAYDNRLLRFTLTMAAGTTDTTATQTQLLNRELDRDTNTIMWQPSGATSPVFFRTLRSPANAILPISPLHTSKQFNVEILAEPFSYGLREDISIGTVNNDPAAGSNGMFFDVSGVKGDVAAPLVITDSAASIGMKAFGIIGCRQHGTPSDLAFFSQAESMSSLTDTVNPGGGPDAAMSGSGSNNFVRTSFASIATMNGRLAWTLPATTAARIASRGTYRAFACIRRSDTTTVFQVQIGISGLSAANSAVNVPTGGAVGDVLLLDLGLLRIGGGIDTPGVYGTPGPIVAETVTLSAARTSGAGTLDWDFLLLVPADEQLMLWDNGAAVTADGIIDAYNEAVYYDDTHSGAIFGGTVGISRATASVAGGFPTAKPGQTNRFVFAWATRSGSELIYGKTFTGTITVSYWPRYLYARPATT